MNNKNPNAVDLDELMEKHGVDDKRKFRWFFIQLQHTQLNPGETAGKPIKR